MPLLAVLGLLVGGGRSALGWSLAALAIVGMGLGMVMTGQAPSPGYQGSSTFDRYIIAILCVIGIGSISQLFEVFWNRSAIEVADRAQAELLAREERNRSLLEHASEGVMVVDSFAVVKFASPAAERLVGVEPGETMGRRLRDFAMHDDFVRTYPVWQRVLSAHGEVAELQLRTRPSLGRAHPSESRVLNLKVANHLDNPAVEGVIVRLQDVTDLSRAEANYQTLVENSLQGIAVHCDGKLVFANQALADMFGVSRDAVVAGGNPEASGDSLLWIHSEDRERVGEAFRKMSPEAIEMRYRNINGDLRWAQMRCSESSWENRPACQIAYADITAARELSERRERENERLAAAIKERTAELEASQIRLREQERMATVGTLAAGIAHQINNPIGSILTSADFAILTADEDQGAETAREALKDIRAQAVRCGKIVRSVLQFSRAEPTEKWSSDLTSVLRTAVDVTSRYAEDRGAQVKLSLCPAASVYSTHMNPIELEQVFVNLIHNAIESRPSGAEVEIRTQLVDDDQIETIISDNGPGIAEGHASHIFDPFYTTRLREGGTGLGLSVAHGIIVDHGGRMWLEQSEHDAAEDDPMRGARFHVLLPTEKAHTPA